MKKSMRFEFRLMTLIAGLLLMLSGQAMAETVSESIGQAQRVVYEGIRSTLSQVSGKLTELSQKVDTSKSDDARLADLKLKVEAVAKASSELSAGLQPRFGLVSKRLEQIGEKPPESPATEDDALAADRIRLTAEKAEINLLTSQAEELAIQATDVANDITDIRRSIFAAAILGRTDLTFQMANETTTALKAEGQDLFLTISSWATFTWNFKRPQLLAAIALALVSGLIFMQFAYRIFNPLFHRSKSEEEPTYIRRLSIAFWSTVIPTLSVIVYCVLFLLFMFTFNVMRPDILQFADAGVSALIAVYFLWRLARNVLAPGRPQWRLVDVSDKGATVLLKIVVVLASINAIDYALDEIMLALDSPVVLTVAKGLIGAVLTGLVILALSFVRPMNSERNNGAWPPIIRFFLVVIGLFLIGAACSGYIGLARFVSSQLVITGSILVTMYIGFLSGRAIAQSGTFAKTAGGRYLENRYHLNNVRLDQIGLAVGLAIYGLVLVAGLPIILLQWGFQIQDIQSLAIRLLTEIRVGNITISLFGLIGGVFVFIAGLIATRWFQRWLDGNVMERSQVEAGVRNSVNTALGYAGVALAGLLGVSAAGIDLSSLALVAGALSLGIGFGLQNIVSNFVSGLILLAERPFKVGDWVVTGKTEGFVKRISVRATEIETFQHQSIIVPNAELINASLGNWTHRNKMGRSEIAIGVSYDADPKHVMDILLELANEHPLVLHTPEPNVAFLGFGDFSLNFELRIYLADLLNGTVVRNDLRLAIFERFRLEGIEIPYPQRNLKIRFEGDDQGLEDALKEEGVPPEITRKIKEQAERRRKKMQESMKENDTGEATDSDDNQA